MNELEEGLAITIEIMSGKAEWSKLFDEVNFFSRYKHFIVLLCVAANERFHHPDLSSVVFSLVTYKMVSVDGTFYLVDKGNCDDKESAPCSVVLVLDNLKKTSFAERPIGVERAGGVEDSSSYWKFGTQSMR
ncbi:unnamed protein product [Toxocara canis]|uniref:4a-hydroxytetrahydrobiopterin dehydratase n=1 Tax=Toxocara canis TaxID=6265 RepID=A0A183U8G4_TOXCA|nr:unnamed protein product [Toxocara canis]